MVPMTKCVGKCTLQNSQAVINFEMTFSNTTKNPVECEYEIPIDKDIIVGGLKAQIKDKEITAVVKKKEEAKVQYDDAVASGKAAVYAEQKKVHQQEEAQEE